MVSLVWLIGRWSVSLLAGEGEISGCKGKSPLTENLPGKWDHVQQFSALSQCILGAESPHP